MSYPIVSLEVQAFSNIWLNVSADIRAIETKRGKQRASSALGAGSMIVVLKNANRTYDPEQTGTLIPRPGQRIRLRATWNATSYNVWAGWIDRVIQEYDPPHNANAILECSDGISRLAAANLPSTWEIATKKLVPLSWYRLGETAGPYAFDRVGSNHGTYYGNPQYNSHTLQSDDDQLVQAIDGAVHFPVGANYIILPAAAVPTTADWTIEFYVAMPAVPPGIQTIIYDALYPKGIRIYFDTVGKLNVQVYKPDGTLGASARCNFSTANGTAYLMQIVAESGLPLKVLFGGYDMTEAASGTAHALNSGGLVVGYPISYAITMDELSLYARALTVTERQARYNDAQGWHSKTVNVRANAVLDSIGWVDGRSITTEADDTLAGTNLGVSALTHLKALADTIGGRLWVTGDGTVKLLGRNEHLAPPYSVSQGTFGDAPLELGYTKAGNYVLDYELLTNVVRRHNHGNYAPEQGSITVASDATSIAKYGLRDDAPVADVESLYLTLAYEYTLAAIQLAKYANPRTYVDSLELKPAKDPGNLWPQALGRDLSDRITFKRLPQGVGTVINLETIIEGISHSIAPKRWITTFSIDTSDA